MIPNGDEFPSRLICTKGWCSRAFNTGSSESEIVPLSPTNRRSAQSSNSSAVARTSRPMSLKRRHLRPFGIAHSFPEFASH